MTRLTFKQLNDVAEWCKERSILADRITGSDVAAACDSLGIQHDGKFDLYQIKDVGTLCEAEA